MTEHRDNNLTTEQKPQKKSFFAERFAGPKKFMAIGLAAGISAVGSYFIAGAKTPDFKDVNITQIGRDVIEGVEIAGPLALGAAGIEAALMALSIPGRGRLELAGRGLSFSEGGFATRMLKAGALAGIGITAVSNAMVIENALGTGPDRNIRSMITTIKESAGPEAVTKDVVFVFQPGTDYFMNTSRVSASAIKRAKEAVKNGAAPGVEAIVPFGMELTEVPTPHNQRQAGLVIYSSGENGQPSAIVPEVKPGAICNEVDNRCVLAPNQLVVDSNEGLSVGDKVEIHGQEFTVVGLSKEDQSLINRLVVFADLPQNTSEYYGFATLADSKETVQSLIDKLQLSKQLSAESSQELIKFNNEFWQQNGTPLVILLFGNIILFGGAAFASIRLFENERDRAKMATLRTIGMLSREVSQIQRARSYMNIATGAVMAYPVALASQKAIDAVLPGFHSELKPEMFAGAAGSMLAAQVVASGIASAISKAKKETVIQLARQA